MHSRRLLSTATVDASSKPIALSSPLLCSQNGLPLCKEAIINIILHLDRKGGPCPEDLPYLEQFSRQILASLASETINKEDLAEISRCLGETYLAHSVNGRSLNKPEGYAGDFMLIEYIYQYLVCPHPQYRNWDLCFHELAGAKAVRNRKHYFKEQAAKLIIRNPEDDFSILTLASGPAREILELYQSLPQHTFFNTCLDADPKALAYAQDLLSGYSDQLEFVKSNVFRYQASQTHDLIWSAGMFDYLSDKLFVYLLKRMKTWLKPNGKIIVGNFSSYNPSRCYMEVFGEWYLHHRSENQLIELALQAGYEMNQIHIGRESLGVNLFLHLSL
ncbi:MAG: methyltransferase domain-containing protein [Bacteroidia bacterium]